jgi:peptide/nickel transport system permease protein
MLTAAQNTEHLRNFPWLLAPGGAIFVTVLAFNFLGDGLRDAADSRS